MIKENDAFEVFEINMERTDMLIQAVDKIGGYNFLYQEKADEVSPDYRSIVKSSQDKELLKISNSCFEHAIISIATAFETYLKELVQLHYHFACLPRTPILICYYLFYYHILLLK